jgi:radical SAM protein with 4Fe4S-binding SPASM domain
MVSLYCPGRCAGCGIWKNGKKSLEGEISIPDFERVLRSESMSQLSYIILTGGESIISDKFVGAVRLIADIHPSATVHINTSGYFPEKTEETIAECLRYIPQEQLRIDISMDGPPDVYKEIRKSESGFDKAMETVCRLKEHTGNIRFVFTIFKNNLQHMDWLIDFAEDVGVGYYFEFPREAVFLNNIGSMGELTSFTPEELEHIEKRLQVHGFINRTDRRIKWNRAKEIYQGRNMLFECLSGYESLVIDPYGNVYPCLETREQLFMGNLADYDNIDQLLSGKRAKDVLNIISKKGCQPCTMLCVHNVGSEDDE